MMLLALLLLLTIPGGVSSKKVCSYHDVLDYLNLTKDNNAFKLTRPVLDWTRPSRVEVDVFLYAILAVIEKTQTFIPFLWATLKWHHERISWDPEQFCGISQLAIPRELLWSPDLFIYEMIQKDDSPLNPYIVLSSDGTVTSEEDLKVVSTCKMDVHKFPFDTQRCNISVSSAVHYVEEVRLIPCSNTSRATEFSREVMKSQGEWDFVQLSVSSFNITYSNRKWENIVYTFTMKRRPLLHVINLLLPILFFLSLDLASFFIADHRGEKLGFKVTVLLAISVLLLILNDILPSMSNKTPLIATYCIVIFALMLLSLLETILVTFLIEKDSQSRDKFGPRDNWQDKQEKGKTKDSNTEKRQTCCACICKESAGEKQHELMSVAEEGMMVTAQGRSDFDGGLKMDVDGAGLHIFDNNIPDNVGNAFAEVNHSIRSEDSHVLLLILKELREQQKTLDLHLNGRAEGGRAAVWAAKINNIFFIFYVSTVSLFLPLIFIEWHT